MSCEEKLALGPCSSTRESDTKLHSQLVSKPQVVRAEWGIEGWLWLQVCVCVGGSTCRLPERRFSEQVVRDKGCGDSGLH